MPISDEAQYIWTGREQPARNAFVMFRRTLAVTQAVSAASVRIFANSKYILWINGERIGRGPARFDPRWPEYDVFRDVSAFRPGLNSMAVLVHHYGEDTFHSIPARACLVVHATVRLADGRERDVLSDGQWRWCPAQAYNPHASRIDLQLAFHEDFDAAQEPAGWRLPSFDHRSWAPAVPFENTVFGRPQPRSIPQLAEREVVPVTLVQSGQFVQESVIYDIHTGYDPARQQADGVALAGTYVFLPRRRRVRVGVSPQPDVEHWVGGKSLQRFTQVQALLPHRQATVTLDKGWHFVLMRIPVGSWRHLDVQWMIPRNLHAVVSATRDPDRPDTWLLAGPYDKERDLALLKYCPMPIDRVEELPPLSTRWVELPAAHTLSNASRTMSWGEYRPVQRTPQPAAFPLQVDPGGAEHGQYFLFDFGRECLGFPRLDVETAPSSRTEPVRSTIELGYAEALGPNGLISPAKHGAYVDRVLTCTGRHAWENFGGRAFRYLLMTVRGEPVTVNGLAVNTCTYPVETVGRFESSDERLNRIWTVGRDTLQLCMEDAYTDCPLRERGQWWGDARVEYRTNLVTFGDHRLMRRGLVQIAQSQAPSGLVAGVYPNRFRGEISDYVLIWVSSLWDYYHYSGDRSLVSELLPSVRRALAWFHNHLDEDGLVSGVAEHLWTLFDWADIDRRGQITCLNAFYYEALVCGSRLARLVGDAALADPYRDQAARVRRAVNRRLWRPGKKCFADCRTPKGLSGASSIHSNVLPLAFGMVPPRHIPSVVDFCTRELQEMFFPNRRGRQWQQKVSPYFMFYVFQALYASGEDTFALDQMRGKYGWMLDQGATTCFENFTPKGSLCHAWSSSPTYYLSSRVLGVDMPVAGRRRRIRIEPHPGDLQWARGVVPHVDGPVQVQWRRTEEPPGFELAMDLPGPFRVELSLPRPGPGQLALMRDGVSVWATGEAHPDITETPSRVEIDLKETQSSRLTFAVQ